MATYDDHDNPLLLLDSSSQMVYGNYDEIFRELPPPPKGKVWKKVRAQDALGCMTKWELMDLDEVRGPADDQSVQGEEEAAKKKAEETGFIEVGIAVHDDDDDDDDDGHGVGCVELITYKNVFVNLWL